MITTIVFRDHRLTPLRPTPEELPALHADPACMIWVDVTAPTPEETKWVLENVFAFHPLVLEDCTTDNPLPKFEEYDDYLFLVMHAVDYSKTDKFTTTELDLMLGKNFLVTFHRQDLRAVQQVIERTQRGLAGPVRGPDRLAHTILDSIYDAYKPALVELRDDLETIEESVLLHADQQEFFQNVVSLRKELAQLRQIVRPQREVASALVHGKNRFIRATMLPYLRDLAEELAHIENQAVASADQLMLSFRVYLNKSSHEANMGIRVITALTALTIPPLLIGGWFGMNFDGTQINDSSYGYPMAISLTLLSMLVMLIVMRRRRWL